MDRRRKRETLDERISHLVAEGLGAQRGLLAALSFGSGELGFELVDFVLHVTYDILIVVFKLCDAIILGGLRVLFLLDAR